MEDINRKAVNDELNKSHSEAYEEIQNKVDKITIKKAKEIEEEFNKQKRKEDGEIE